MLRLLICDDAPDAREAVRASLAEQPEIEVVAEAENGEEAIALAASHHPNVILMDVRMPVLDGIAATRRIRDLLPKTRIVAYAGSDDADDVMAMMEAGADAYCVKGAPLWELERALAGASDPLMRLAHGISRSVHGGGIAELVARELAELRLLAGLALGCYVVDMDDHRSRILPRNFRILQDGDGAWRKGNEKRNYTSLE